MGWCKFGVSGESSVSYGEMRLLDSPRGYVAIYVLIDPRDDTVRYVGASKRPKKRLMQHLSSVERSAGVPPGIGTWFSDMKEAGVSPRMEIVQVSPAITSAAVEEIWIDFYRCRGGLTNARVYPSYSAGVPSRETILRETIGGLNIDLRLRDYSGAKLARAW